MTCIPDSMTSGTGVTTGIGTPASIGKGVSIVGLVSLALPSSVVTRRGPVGSRHVEPVVTVLALGLVHLHVHSVPGESAVPATGRDSTSEHVS